MLLGPNTHMELQMYNFLFGSAHLNMLTLGRSDDNAIKQLLNSICHPVQFAAG